MQAAEIPVRNIHFMPPKSIMEFIMTPKRWQVPDFKHIDRLILQVKKNLLFFQTNYFIASAVFFVVVFLLSIKTLMTGLISSAIITFAGLFFADYLPQAEAIKRDHPTAVVVIGCVLSFILWHALAPIISILALALCFVPVWIIHAMFRNADNLLESNMKGQYFVKTPMGRILALIGLSPVVP